MNFPFFRNKDKQQEANAEGKEKINQRNLEKSDAGGVLVPDSILIGQKSVTRDEAIEMAGQLLVDGGYVLPGYIDAMKERERILTTYIGEGIAIPHGILAAKDKILKSGISILQFPEGVEFGEGKIAYLVVGIAGKGNEHMKILTNLAEFIQEGETIKEMFTTKDKMCIYNAFTNKL